jgi:hypothetical protein
MTQTELFDILIDLISDADDKYDKDALTELCEKQKERLAKKALAAKKAAAKKQEDSDELTDVIHSILTDEPMLIADIAAKIAGPDVTVAKVTSRLGKLARDGKAVMVKVSVPNPDGGKASKRSAYKLA